MATLTIRNLEDPLKSRLRLRAAARNRSMEEEARQILRAALQEPSERVNDFATPGVMNLLCGAAVFERWLSPLMAG